MIAASSLEAGSLQALRGKRFTFGSPLSTSGHVMPRFFLLQQGLVPEKLFGSVSYSGDHKKTVLAVASGQQDCGAVNYKVFDQMVAEKAVDPAKVKVVWTSPTFVDQSWESFGSVLLSSSGMIRFARALPSSTPHWSNESIPQMTPWVKTLCS